MSDTTPPTSVAPESGHQQPSQPKSRGANACLENIQMPIFSVPPLRVGSFLLQSRLVVGTGKYKDVDQMRQALQASGADVITVAVRRERLFDKDGRSLLDALPLDQLTILPNTAGCFNAVDAVRVARLGRELLQQLADAESDR